MPLWASALIWLFYVATGYLVYDYASELDWKAFWALRLDWWLFFAALVATTISRFATYHAFDMMLRKLAKVDYGWIEGNSAYARSWLGRYMPGKVTGFLARVLLFAHMGAPHGAVAIGSVLEVSLWIFTNFIIGFAGIVLSGNALSLPPQIETAVYVVAALSIFSVLPVSINLAVRIILRITGRSHLAEGMKVGSGAIVAGIAGVLIAQVTYGVSFWLMAASIDSNVTISLFPLIWGAFDIAGAMGLAAVFAPAGIGVREIVLLPFLTKVMSPEASIAMLGLARLMELAADLIYWPTSVWMGKFFAGRGAKG